MATTKVYKDNKTGRMWVQFSTGEREENSKFFKKQSYTVQSVEGGIPQHMWRATQSGNGKYVEIDLGNYDIKEVKVVKTVEPITTVGGMVLTPGREWTAIELVFVPKPLDE